MTTFKKLTIKHEHWPIVTREAQRGTFGFTQLDNDVPAIVLEAEHAEELKAILPDAVVSEVQTAVNLYEQTVDNYLQNLNNTGSVKT